MIGAGSCGVYTVITSDNDQVAGFESLLNFGDVTIELFECISIAARVISMAVDHVELDQVDEHQTFEILFQHFERNVETLDIGQYMIFFVMP